MDTHDSTTKTCSKCGTEYPATVEFFKREKRMKLGLHSWCNDCRRLYDRERHKTPKRQEWVKNYRSKPEVKKKHLSEQKEYYFERGGKEKQNSRRTPEFRQKDNQAHKTEKARSADRERKKRLRNDPEVGLFYRMKAKAWQIRYEARKRNLPSDFTAHDWEQTLNHFRGCCAVCRKELGGLFHTAAADHWIPISNPDCPGTVPWNIIPLCHGLGGCNNSKSNRDPIEWLTEKLGKRAAKKKLAEIEAYFDLVRPK